MKYTPDEARNLKTYGEFPETGKNSFIDLFKRYLKYNWHKNILSLVRINDTVTFVDDGLDEDIEFGDDISDDEEADNAVDNVRSHLHVYIC